MRPGAHSAGSPSARVVHRARGAFGEWLVLDEGPRRHLRFGGIDGVDQTVTERRRPGLLPTCYLRAATVGAALADPLRRALLIGLGGGSYARFLQRRFHGVAVDVVEIDPIVVQLARDYFDLREGRGLRLFVEDAAAFVADAAADPAWRYDFILLDAYHGQKIPPALARQSFFRKVADLLTDGGIAAANVGLPERWSEDRVLQRFARAFRGGCFEIDVADEDNRIIFGARARMAGARRLASRLRKIDAEGRLPFELLPLIRGRRIWRAD